MSATKIKKPRKKERHERRENERLRKEERREKRKRKKVKDEIDDECWELKFQRGFIFLMAQKECLQRTTLSSASKNLFSLTLAFKKPFPSENVFVSIEEFVVTLLILIEATYFAKRNAAVVHNSIYFERVLLLNK